MHRDPHGYARYAQATTTRAAAGPEPRKQAKEAVTMVRLHVLASRNQTRSTKKLGNIEEYEVVCKQFLVF